MAAATSKNNFASESQPARFTSVTVYTPPPVKLLLFHTYGKAVAQTVMYVILFVAWFIVAATAVLDADMQPVTIFRAAA